ncbi:MAG TPA: peptidylprolyl isomerase, partial [Candidatus Limnocylindria bacterium]|nr:peptidylprolyl isomerase [Candidatus Limnocylindria bacterium]
IQYDRAGELIGGQDTNGSQFFVALANLPLPPYYSVFGTVTAGTDVVDAIAALPVNDPQVGVPLDPAIIETISISPAAGEAGGSPGA